MAGKIAHPKPYADWETRGYWEGCGRHELILQRCGECGVLRHRPRSICPECLSDRIEWVEASGKGTVHTYTVTNQNQAPAWREAVPYVLAYVELEEGVRLLTNIVGWEPGDVRIGQPVVVDWADLEDGGSVPRFRPT